MDFSILEVKTIRVQIYSLHISSLALKEKPSITQYIVESIMKDVISVILKGRSFVE